MPRSDDAVTRGKEAMGGDSPQPAASQPQVPSQALTRGIGLIVLCVGIVLSAVMAWVLSGLAVLGLARMQPTMSTIIILSVVGLLAVFCDLAGYRLLFNRPNASGSLFSPMVWYGTCAVFVLISLLLAAHTFLRDGARRSDFLSVGYGIAFAVLSWRAGKWCQKRASGRK